MIKIIKKDYVTKEEALNITTITIFGVPIYKNVIQTTKPAVIDQYNTPKPPVKIKGFRNTKS